MSEDLPLLAGSSLFGLLERHEQAALAERLGTRRFEAGETLFERGDPGAMLYLVRRGLVRIFLENDIGDTIVLAESAAGDLFGEISLLDGGCRTANAIAVEETEVLILGREELFSFLKDYPHAAIGLLEVMGRRLRETDDLLRRCVTRNLNEQHVERMTWGERVADRVASFGGSWSFIIFFGFVLVTWMGINAFLLASRPFDPYPFILLNLVLSTLAALQAPVIMMSQNRQAFKDRLKADLDFDVNRKAELEIAQLHGKFERLYETMQAQFQKIESSAKNSSKSATP
jgi:CRP/FNR family cyclic AMP-dependent transcriptional regulator